MARLYTDEHFPLGVTKALRRLGHNVLTIQEAGYSDQRIPDNEVLAFATQHERAVITMNRRHFVVLHHRQPDHAGIIVCTQDTDIEGQALRVHRAVEAAGVLAGNLIRVNRPSR